MQGHGDTAVRDVPVRGGLVDAASRRAGARAHIMSSFTGLALSPRMPRDDPAFAPGSTVSAMSLAALAGSSRCDTPKGRDSKWTPERLYTEAKEEEATGNYERGDKLYERLEGRASGTCWRSRRKSNAPTCSARGREGAGAVDARALHQAASDQPGIDYALYLQGLINFNDNLGFSAASPPGPVGARPAGLARLLPVVQAAGRAFPQSPYADDARAAHELHRQLARRLRSARRALLLPARRLRGRGEPGAAAVQEFQPRRRRRKRSSSWPRATTSSA